MVNLLEKNEQTGRSMVEMLGVLAIIGVLSVGGIAGYSKAMTKFKITKTMDQVSMMVANIRTLYSGQRNYSGLATGNALDMGVVPAEMEGADSAVGANTLVNAFQGAVTIGTVNYNQQTASAFRVSYENMGQEACVQLLRLTGVPAHLPVLSVFKSVMQRRKVRMLQPLVMPRLKVPLHGIICTYRLHRQMQPRLALQMMVIQQSLGITCSCISA